MAKRRKIETDSDENMEHQDRKKKNLAVFMVLIVALAGIGAASTYWIMEQPGGYVESGTGNSGISGASSSGEENTGGTTETIINADLTVGFSSISSVEKKVIGELFVTTTCPYCAKTEDDLTQIETQRDDFYFVTFVLDKNQDAYLRYKQISQNQGTPDTEFDGGYRSELGAVELGNFLNDIEACKNAPGAPVEIAGSITSESGTKASVSLNVFVGDKDFQGNVKAFVIDKKSPWINVNQERIPNAFVGYLLNEDVSLSGGDVSKSGQWKVSGAKSFSELAVVVVVYDSGGHALQAYRIDL